MKHLSDQKGFTLVELAIVMIIIGLLIGGILKGQELITNAQVSSSIAQIKGIDAALTTFRDSYNAVPGDMVNATSRLPSCNDGICVDAPAGASRGNSKIDGLAAGTAMAANTENVLAWIHLAYADLVSGIDTSAATPVSFGGYLPNANIGGGYTIGYFPVGATVTLPGTVNGLAPRGGHYIAITALPGTLVGGAGTGTMSAGEAARIDRKLDDGAPETGSVIAADDGTGCQTAVGGAEVYDEPNNPGGCSLYVRVQQ